MVPYAECDPMIDNQCAAQILYHICDSIFILSAGIALFMTVNIMEIPRLELQDVAEVLDWIFLIFPHYSMCASINNMYNNYVFNRECSNVLPNRTTCDILPNACCRGK